MDYSLYLHIPFCRHRCAYCDFNTYAGQEQWISEYVHALQREIEWVGESAPEPLAVHTVFFGGGTPSLLSPAQFESILGAIGRRFRLREGAEITMEANPGTVTREALRELRALGINRISYGAQSANSEELRMLERTHSFLDVIEAVAAARAAGFDNLNVDLIYGLPEQSLESWQRTVRSVLALGPEHISAYALTLEHGTPFGRWAKRGMLPLPDPDVAAEQYEWASEAVEAAGFSQYEISNWAKGSRVDGDPGSACRHNLQYWRGLPYLGFGAGAHGYAAGVRYSNALRIRTYISRLANATPPVAAFGFPISPAVVNRHNQTREDEQSEFMMTGLRLTDEGVSDRAFSLRFGCSLTQAYGPQISELIEIGLLEWVQDGDGPSRLRLARQGRLLGNRAFVKFI